MNSLLSHMLFLLPFSTWTLPPKEVSELKPAALVIAVSGEVFLSGRGLDRQVRRFDWLYPGDRLRTGHEGRLTLVFWDGTRYLLEPHTAVGIDERAPSDVTGHLVHLPSLPALPKLARLAADEPKGKGAGVRLRQGGAQFAFVSARLRLPLAEVTIWIDTHDGLQGAHLFIEDEHGRPVYSCESETNQIVLPEGTLLQDTLYFLRVTSRHPYYAGESGHELQARTLKRADDQAYQALKAAILKENPHDTAFLQWVARRLDLDWEAARLVQISQAGAGPKPLVARCPKR